MAQIYDNIEKHFTEGLQGIITNTGVKRVDFCVGYFNLRGWNLITNQVDSLSGDYVEEDYKSVFRTCRLLIGMHQPNDELTRWLYGREEHMPDANFVRDQKIKIAIDFRKQLQIGLPSKQDEWTLRRLSSQMKDGKVCVKLYCKEPLHAKLYLAHRPDDNFNRIQALMGSSNLTFSGLTKQGELNAEFADSDQAVKFAKWFDDRWNDRFCIDITKELIEVIDNSWATQKNIPPYYIYLKTAYHLSQEARNGINEFVLAPEFRKDLFDFQQMAVKIATRHLRNGKRGGAMIGDVVGLGKTITACAIAKLYETNFASTTLIICPANLQDMWHKYIKKYDLKAEVVSIAKTIDVEQARYYRLIIIDESHNLRNGAGGRRYQNIKQLIDHLDSNVLLLTATPYNKDFRDLGNQLRLFLADDQDLGIRPEAYIRSLGGERQFIHQHSEVHIRSIAAFEKSPFVEDWNELMRLFLVRRTRTFIKENYAKTDPENGRKYLLFPDKSRSYFPDRLPRSLKFPTIPGDQYSRLYSQEMIDIIGELRLPRYGLSKYIKDEAIEQAGALDKQVIDDLSRAGWRMIGICMSTFFKRIDSSGFAFLLTLYRHILRNMVFVYAIENKLPIPIGDNNTLPEEYIDDEVNLGKIEGMGNEKVISGEDKLHIPTDLEHYRGIAADYYETIVNRGNVSWLSPTLFKRTLKQHLLKDCESIINMINLCGEWEPANDQKLNRLYDLITHIHPDEKIVVFSQFSDTAQYLYKQLMRRGVKQLAVVTGDTNAPTDIVEKFSPLSNEKPHLPKDEQYRVIIATDVLSEGQNLQDSHIVVNYDLPWAIIRLIQRAGRVDRIGQHSQEIYCYSFFPAEGVEKIIGLRQRLNDRINENAQVVGSDEVFFEGNEQNLKDMFNEKSGVLDEDDDNDVDLASYAYQIWKNATEADPELNKIIPALSNMIYSTKQVDSIDKDGVITYARTSNDFDVLTWLDVDGNFVTQSQKRILQALACDANTPSIDPLENHHELVADAVELAQQESTITNIGGMLGNRFSTRYRIINLLEHYHDQQTNLFFNEEQKHDLKLAIDDIYNYPLQEVTKTSLGQMLHRNQRPEDIVDYVLELRQAGNLCRKPEQENQCKDPTIICSMGMRFEK